MSIAAATSILSATDPAPVEIMNEDAGGPILLVCEHAGQAIPACLEGLGIGRAVLDSHRGWDIGALAVARAVADRLTAPLIIQHYSRLVIDVNRPPESAHAVPSQVDGEVIPGNVGITPGQQALRAQDIFEPFDAAVSRMIAHLQPRGCFSIHSFTPSMGGTARPWHGGFLTRANPGTAQRMIDTIAARDPRLKLAINQPYTIDDETDWFIPRHAEPCGASHALIEIRNDMIGSANGVILWADHIAHAIRAALQEETV